MEDDLVEIFGKEREDYEYGFHTGYNAVLAGDLNAYPDLNSKTPIANASAYEYGFHEGVRQARWNLQIFN